MARHGPVLRPQLDAGLATLGLPLAPEATEQLLAYLDELLHWNRRVNLTAVRDPQQALVKHVLDSLTVARHCRSGRLIDVGSGAGLPGIPLALARPDLQIVSVDSRGRKIDFQQHAVRALGLVNLEPRHARIEDLAGVLQSSQIVSRAFAGLADFAQAAGPCLAAGGELLAMKGRRPDSELAALASGWKAVKIERLSVPGLTDERHLVVLRRDPEHEVGN